MHEDEKTRGTVDGSGPVRVAVTMLTVSPGGMGGGETYARALTRTFAGVPAIEATAIVPANARGFSEAIPERVAEGVRSGDGIRRRAIGMLQALARTRALHRLTGDAEILYFPFTVPLPYPRRRQGFVQMVFDLQHLDLPELFSPAEKAFRRVAYEATARRADAIITISAFTKQRIVELLGIDPDRIHVAHLGVDREHFDPHLGEREDFVLFPARAWPHKNHARLVEAVALLRRTRPGLRLVLTGGNVDELGELPDFVDRRGLVSLDELRDLYRRASVLAFPSLYEGFGLPPLEAMASGCPVASSTAGSLPEICGDAAEYFDPTDVEAMASAIGRAIDDGPALSRRGLERVALFDWNRCRDEHVAVFESVARDRRAGMGRRRFSRRRRAGAGAAS